jgi:hypothetical protein
MPAIISSIAGMARSYGRNDDQSRHVLFPRFSHGSENIPAGRRVAHCDAALNRMVSVDHAGKLFERIEGNAPAGQDKRYRNNNTGIPPHSASFCPRHGNYPVQGAFRNRRADFFCYFSLDVKEK